MIDRRVHRGPTRSVTGLLLALAAFVGCTSDHADDALVVWHAYRGAEQHALAAAAERFMKGRPGERVRLVAIPYDAFPNKLSVAIPRGNGPDLFIFSHDRVGDWARAGLLEPLGVWLDAETTRRFFPSTLDALIYRGDLYGLPLAFKTLALYRNTDLAPEAPETTDALVTAVRAARARRPGVWGVAWELDSFYFHAPWLHGFGGTVYAPSQDGAPGEGAERLALDSPEAVASVRFVRRWLVDERLIPEEVTSALFTGLFRERKLAFVVSGPWFRAELTGHEGWAVSPLPVVSETGLPARPFLGVEAVQISARSTHLARAVDFARFLTTDDEALLRATTAGQLVANRTPYGSDALRGDAFLDAFRRQGEIAVALSNRPHMRAVWTPMKAALSQGIVLGRDPGAALREAVSRVDRMTE